MAENGFSIAWEGVKLLQEALERVSEQADEGVKEIVARSAALAEKEAKANFEGSHAKGKPHVGGDKPNIVTGTLRRSIRSDPITRYGLAEYGTTVAPRVKYARRVELGGSRGYAYFRPGVETASAEFHKIAAEVWAKFITGR